MGYLTARQRVNFESHFIPEPMSGCFLWAGCSTSEGYGRVRVHNRTEFAHRVAYSEYVGEIPDVHLVRHKCDNPSRVNPSHLVLGSDVDNAFDKVLRRRVHRKVSNDDVLAIRSALGRYRDIAAAHGVSASFVSLIKNGQRRSYVGG